MSTTRRGFLSRFLGIGAAAVVSPELLAGVVTPDRSPIGDASSRTQVRVWRSEAGGKTLIPVPARPLLASDLAASDPDFAKAIEACGVRPDTVFHLMPDGSYRREGSFKRFTLVRSPFSGQVGDPWQVSRWEETYIAWSPERGFVTRERVLSPEHVEHFGLDRFDGSAPVSFEYASKVPAEWPPIVTHEGVPPGTALLLNQDLVLRPNEIVDLGDAFDRANFGRLSMAGRHNPHVEDAWEAMAAEQRRKRDGYAARILRPPVTPDEYRGEEARRRFNENVLKALAGDGKTLHIGSAPSGL